MVLFEFKQAGHFLPFFRGQISAPFPIEKYPPFSQYHVCFSELRKVKKKKNAFLKWYGRHFMQSKITWFWKYILLPLLYSMSLISPNFAVVLIIFFPILARGLFPKLLEKALTGLQIRGNYYNGKLFLNQNIWYGYSKEPSQWDGSFEHPNHMFNLMGKKIITILC